MVKLLKRAIITEWKNITTFHWQYSINEWSRGLEKSWMCWEEWLWTCQALQYRLNNGVY